MHAQSPGEFETAWHAMLAPTAAQGEVVLLPDAPITDCQLAFRIQSNAGSVTDEIHLPLGGLNIEYTRARSAAPMQQGVEFILDAGPEGLITKTLANGVTRERSTSYGVLFPEDLRNAAAVQALLSVVFAHAERCGATR